MACAVDETKGKLSMLLSRHLVHVAPRDWLINLEPIHKARCARANTSVKNRICMCIKCKQ